MMQFMMEPLTKQQNIKYIYKKISLYTIIHNNPKKDNLAKTAYPTLFWLAINFDTFKLIAKIFIHILNWKI